MSSELCHPTTAVEARRRRELVAVAHTTRAGGAYAHSSLAMAALEHA